MKSYDTEAVAARLAPLIGPSTAVLSIQNGVDNEPKIAAAIGAEHVLGAAVYVLAAVESPGVVRSGPARVVVGELVPGPPSRPPRAATIRRECRARPWRPGPPT